MNKKFTKLIAALALLVFMMPSLAGWGQTKAEGDELAICQGTGSGYGIRRTLTDSHGVGWVLASGQTGYLGVNNNTTNYSNTKPTAADLPVVKAVNQYANTNSTGLFYYYTTTAVSNVGSLEFSYTANQGNSSATAYVVVGDALSVEGGTNYTKIELASDSPSAQGVSLGTSGTFTFKFANTQTSARYYGFVIQTNSYKRMTGGTIKLLEGSTGPVTYSVTYKANEGTGDDLVDGGYSNGTLVTVKANEGIGNPNFTRTGYDFNKWNTKANGTGTYYTSGSTFNISSNTNLFAQWTKHNYNVAVSSIEDVTLTATYDANTIAEGNNANVPYGTAVTLAATDLGAGQAFVWSITKTADGTDVTADVLSGTTLTVPDYAVTIGGTVATTYTVTYDCNGGTSGCPENVTGIASGASITLAAAPTKTNYVFTGWNDGTTTYQAGASYTVNGDVTLTAQWVAGGTGTITFGSASGSVQINAASIQANDNLENEWDITTVGGGFAQNAAYSQVGTGNNRASSITFSMELPTSYQITSLSAKFGAFTGDTGSITLMVGESTVGSGSLDGTNDVVTTSNVVVIGNELTVSVTNTNNLRVKCYYITYTFTAIGDDPIISALNTINLISTDTDNEFAYEIVNPVSGKTLSATTTTSWISNINVTSEKVTFTTSENTSTTDDRQGSITLSYDGAEDKVVTINQGKVDYAAMPFSYTGNGNSGSLVTGLTSNLTSSYTNGWPAMKFDAAGRYLTLKLHEAPASISYDIRPSASSWTGTFKVQTSADGENFTDLVSYTSLSNDTETKTHVDLPSTVRYIRWYFDTKSSGYNVALGNIKANTQYDIYGTATTATFAPTDTKKCTIYNGGVLTVTGTLTNTTAANLIIEDGGQLVHGSTGVYATVKKHIDAADDWNDAETGWNFIASPIKDPFTPSVASNILTTELTTPYSYDLYRFNQSESKEWENYHQYSFNLDNGKGYLYARREAVDLVFTGELANSDGEVGLVYDENADANKRGWNLVGNPFTCIATVGMTHYVVDGRTITASNAAVAPCTGIMVQTTSVEQDVVTFTKAPTEDLSAPKNASIQMLLAQTVATRSGSNMETLDNAIVSFNEGDKLGKFYFGTQNANIYIPQDGEQYAIVSSEARGEMPVCFKANADGQYTLTVNPENVEMGYLHLIDNIAGTDVDLIATPSYTFSAKADDYESRFRLVFSANNADIDLGDDFAFISDGRLIIANEGEATLQVIDVTGRILSSEAINGSVSKAISAKAGVYVLRLVNGNEVKTQKIIVK